MKNLNTIERIQQDLPAGFKVYKKSCFDGEESRFALVRDGAGTKKLYVAGLIARHFTGAEAGNKGKLCPLGWDNAQVLMEVFSWLKPQLPPSLPSFGCGDRIGLATPGHIRAMEDVDVFPVLAQQSIREMERTGRTPEDVLNTAVWGVFKEGYKAGYAADADHLKTYEAVKRTASVGFNMFTCDPSEHVNPDADDMSVEELQSAFDSIDNGQRILDKYEGKKFTAFLPQHDYEFQGTFDRNSLQRAAIKYYDAVQFAGNMYRWVEDEVEGEFIFEVSVDETENPTSPLEHTFIVKELIDRDVNLFSLAPRFAGNIQKGIDYIGDLDLFEDQLKAHGAIANTYGNYRLSLHSGSDKFTIYPYFGEYLGHTVHIKTAGTSYLEAIRLVAQKDPGLFRDIYRYSLDRFDKDRATYHVETDLEKVPLPEEVDDGDLPGLLDEDDPRQVLHVAYGSVLTCKEGGDFKFKGKIKKVLRENEDEHYQLLKDHIGHHVKLLT